MNDLKVIQSTMKTSWEITSIEFSIYISDVLIFVYFSYYVLIIQAKMSLYVLFIPCSFYAIYQWTY